MSVAFTEQAVRDRTKTVTRRKGWEFLVPGDRLTLCRKVMGRRGEPLVRIAEVEVVHVRREPLFEITDAEVALEGFPGMSPIEFVHRFFVEAQGMRSSDEVTRIEWRYLDEKAEENDSPARCTKAPNCPHGDGHDGKCSTPLAGLSEHDVVNLRWLLGRPGEVGPE